MRQTLLPISFFPMWTRTLMFAFRRPTKKRFFSKASNPKKLQLSGIKYFEPREMYDEVAIYGSVQVLGDLSAKKISVTGRAKFMGNVNCDDIAITGFAAIEGDMLTKNFSCKGNTLVRHNLETNNLDMNGSLKVRGDVEAINFKLKGIFRVSGDVEADRVTISSAFSSARSIRAEIIKATLLPSSLHEEYPEEVYEEKSLFTRLVNWFKISFWRRTFVPYSIKASTFSADYVYVEQINTNLLKGRYVVCGPGCKVSHLEYRVYHDIHQSSGVGTVTQLPFFNESDDYDYLLADDEDHYFSDELEDGSEEEEADPSKLESTALKDYFQSMKLPGLEKPAYTSGWLLRDIPDPDVLHKFSRKDIQTLMETKKIPFTGTTKEELMKELLQWSEEERKQQSDTKKPT